MTQITKHQHFVPAFMLKFWLSKHKKQLVCHDLNTYKSFRVHPDKILGRRYFYELDKKQPDNRVENYLSKMESDWAPILETLHTLTNQPYRHSRKEQLIKEITQALDPIALEHIKTFAAYQYSRTPGAMEQKRFELGASEIEEHTIEEGLLPGNFVTEGVQYTLQRIHNMKTLFMISKEDEFLTSDWPCFDLRDDDFSPLIGEEIGHNPEVMMYMPLTPKVALVLVHHNFAPNIASNTPHLQLVESRVVKNQNQLLIQQADRYVIAQKECEFIFKVARKRKKADPNFLNSPAKVKHKDSKGMYR